MHLGAAVLQPVCSASAECGAQAECGAPMVSLDNPLDMKYADFLIFHSQKSKQNT